MANDSAGTPDPSDPHSNGLIEADARRGVQERQHVTAEDDDVFAPSPMAASEPRPRPWAWPGDDTQHQQLPTCSTRSSIAVQAVSVAMDYSAHDPDHPGGSDPWASSPQHNRTTFAQPPTSDIPSSPLPPQASPYGQGPDHFGYLGDQGQQQQRPASASENGDPHQPPFTPGDGPQAPHQQAPPHQGQEQQRTGQPQRYHGNRPQRQQPAYKLTAKVTALERTGRSKDPILRFDVYVCANIPLHVRAASLPFTCG